jgi:polysaccharide pyruvyl transferase WcaK-like protein
MTPERPPPSKFNQDIPADAIGINLSPLIAYFRGGNTKQSGLEDWTSSCAKLVLAAAELGRPIVLTPPVGSAAAFTEDFGLLRAVHQLVKDKASVPITFLSGDFNAAELKWLISKFAVFAGARTHSTIAAISSQVPTLSISYSIKAKGINRDVYDNLDYCVHVSDLTPDVFREKLRLLLSNETSIREHLSARIPQLIDRAFAAGETLRNLLQSPALQGLESDSDIQALSSHC